MKRQFPDDNNKSQKKLKLTAESEENDVIDDSFSSSQSPKNSNSNNNTDELSQVTSPGTPIQKLNKQNMLANEIMSSEMSSPGTPIEKIPPPSQILSQDSEGAIKFKKKETKKIKTNLLDQTGNAKIIIPNAHKRYRKFSTREKNFLEHLYSQKIGYTQSASVLTTNLSAQFGHLCNDIDRVKKWFLNRHLDKRKHQSKKHELQQTTIIFSPKINTRTELTSFYPGCWDCKVAPDCERSAKCLSCKYIFHVECLNTTPEYDDLEFRFLSSCNFCAQND